MEGFILFHVRFFFYVVCHLVFCRQWGLRTETENHTVLGLVRGKYML